LRLARALAIDPNFINYRGSTLPQLQRTLTLRCPIKFAPYLKFYIINFKVTAKFSYRSSDDNLLSAEQSGGKISTSLKLFLAIRAQRERERERERERATRLAITSLEFRIKFVINCRGLLFKISITLKLVLQSRDRGSKRRKQSTRAVRT
jgi:hypothetical protein